jgi:hypothetical protein
MNNVKSPKTLKEKNAVKARWITSGVILVAVAVLFITGLASKLFQTIFPTPTPEVNPEAQISEAGVTAYLNFDRNNYDTWIANLCSISTDLTCADLKNTDGPKMKAAADKAGMNSTVTNVKAIKMVAENQSDELGHQQIWAVTYTYSNWNGTKDTYDYVTITEGNGVWKFDGFTMVPQNILNAAFGAQLTPQATDTVQP